MLRIAIILGSTRPGRNEGAHIDAVVQEQVGMDRVGFGVVIVAGSSIRAL
jgi:hypothetical protein